jgi:hypothetical protein
MGKVRNRLPLHLGLVYAQRRTPLRAILDAGRRMLQQQPLGGQELWTVQADPTRGALPIEKQCLAEGTQQFQETIAVKLSQNDRSLTWYVPAMMGDGTTKDVWYPYVFLETDVEPTERSRRFQAPNPRTGKDGWLVHAGELQEGDQVHFTPATLDWAWLDVAGRRFEIAYDEQGQRRGLPRRPYVLDELETIEQIWEALSHHLSPTQIHALRDLIEAKREGWCVSASDGTFRQFCHDTLANAEWKPTPWEESRWEQWLDTWADYAARGWLADVVELYMQIMKQEPERSANEEVKP